MKAIVFILAVLLFTACTKKPTSSIKVVTETVNELKVEYQFDSLKKVKQGYYKTFHPNGNLASEKTYVNDTLNGLEKEFFPTGKISGEFTWLAGKYDGDFKYYHENAKLKQEGKYVNNVMKGELKTYYESGKLKEVVTMEDSQEKGPFTEYHENGNLKAKGEFSGGAKSEICILEKYDNDGKIESKMLCNGKGLCCTIWTVEKGDIKTQNNPLCIELLKEMKDKCPSK